jgi:hypothetical protein
MVLWSDGVDAITMSFFMLLLFVENYFVRVSPRLSPRLNKTRFWTRLFLKIDLRFALN